MRKSAKIKKDKIIKTAIAVFAEKGFRKTTMSELAKSAGISEATLYKHYNNKEKILFSVPVSMLQDFLATLEEQFSGIKDPEEKLRKFIWQYLWWSQKHKNIVKILIFEIEPNLNFYGSEVHALTREIGKVVVDILAQGKTAGVFRSEITPRIFMNFMMGTMNYMLLTCLVFNRPFQPLEDYDALAKAIFAAATCTFEQPTLDIAQIEEKREKILMAAEKLLSRKNHIQTSIFQIAQKAGVAEGTIYEYFENKEDILFSLYEKRMKSYSNTFDETLKPDKPETKLRHILWHHLNWAYQHPRWATVYLRDIVPNPRFYHSKKHEVMRMHDRKLMRIIEQGMEAGVFRKDFKHYLVRSLIFGPMRAMGNHWSFASKDYQLVNDLDDWHDLIFRALKKQD